MKKMLLQKDGREIYIGFKDGELKTIFKIKKFCKNCYAVETYGLKENICKWFVSFEEVKKFFRIVKEYRYL